MSGRWLPRRLDRNLLAATVVATIAVALRWPSCTESFWVDELHSAWAVWDSLGEVFPRARMGHQSPFYFVGLWFWKQLAGSSELALRLSSVIAVAIACGLLTACLSRWSHSLTAGILGGLLLATERNSIFFGTELRPYAVVMMLSTVVLLLMLRLLDTKSRQADSRAWCGMIAAILLAGLCQPTAIGVLIWPVLVLMTHWVFTDWRALLRFQLSDALLLVAAAAMLFYLWRETLGESWKQRTTWAAFASATDPVEIWRIWDWTWLLILPLAISVVGRVVAYSRKGKQHTGTVAKRDGILDSSNHSQTGLLQSLVRGTLVSAVLAILCTGSYWLVSYLEIAPLWHRRYFVAVLPCFAVVTAGSLGILQRAVSGWKGSGLLTATFGLALATILPWQQGILASLPNYPSPLVRRGEDWRSAVRWVNQEMKPNDLLFVDAGLIEASQMLGTASSTSTREKSERDRQYLTYPVRGPYKSDHHPRPVKLRPTGAPRTISRIQQSNRRVFVIARIPSRSFRLNGDESLQVYASGSLSIIVQSRDKDVKKRLDLSR